MLWSQENYSKLEECEFIETEQEAVLEILTTCEQMVFIDTCMMSTIYRSNRIGDIINYLEECYSEDIVIVFTDTLLYELLAFSNGVSKNLKKIFKSLNKKYKVVFLDEEWLLNWRKQLVEEDDVVLNQKFKDVFMNYKTSLLKVDKYANDQTQSYYNMLYGTNAVEGSETFISDIISVIKSKKKSGDSLAELLIFLCILYMMDLYETDYEQFAFCFFTADRKAGARVKDLQKRSDMFLRSFEFCTVGHLVHEMYAVGVFDCDESAKSFVKDLLELKTETEKIKVSIYQTGMLEVTEKEYTIDEFIETLKDDSIIKVVY